MIRRLAISYFGGAIAGLACSLALWLVARAGLLAAIGVSLAPALTWPWLAPRLLWGGLFGLGYPLAKRLALSPTRAGLLLSLVPSAVQLLYFFPTRGEALFGTSHGVLTPLVVLATNAVWGYTLARVAAAAGDA